MSLVKFIEENRGDAAQHRILDQLAQQNTFGDKSDAGALGDNALEADLITDFLPKPRTALVGHARGEQPRRYSSRLKHHHFTVAEHSMIEQNLRNLG